MNKMILAVLLLFPVLAGAAEESTVTRAQRQRANWRRVLPANVLPDALAGLVNVSPNYYFAFDGGASASATDTKGYSIRQFDGTAYDSTALVTNYLYFDGGGVIGEAALVAETLPPIMIAAGLEMDGDATSGDGFEFFLGTEYASSRPIIAGVDPAFFSCAVIYSADVSVWSQLSFGFRRPETVNAVFDNYIDLAAIGCSASAATCDISTDTIDDNAATTTTDTTLNWADGETKTFCVYGSKTIDSTGAAMTYSVNGTTLTAAQAGSFKIDQGTPLQPFIHGIKGSAAASSTVISLWFGGFQQTGG